MVRSALAFAFVSVLFLAPLPALAAPPDAAKVRLASDEFDAGARAFKDKDFELAASRFEAADDAVPSAKVLRLAIRARDEAGQGSRAATLAALALDRYGADEETKALADDIIAKNEASLHKVSVSCASPCILAVGTRAIHGEATTRWVLYLDPGKTTISASFFGDAGAAQETVKGKAGGSTNVRLEPKGDAAVVPVESPDSPPEKADPAPSAEPPAEEEAPRSGLHPAFFITGLVLTAGAAGVTVWSGLDAQNNPGVDAVRAACAGKTTDCPEYQQGVSSQNRTNILIGASAGVAALTLVVGAFLTDWGSDDKSAERGAAPKARTALSILPGVAPLDGGAAFFATGRF